MDTSEQYIKMRIAAIPDMGVGASPSLFHHTPNGWVDEKGDFYTHTDEEPYYCQLERQDQLQEMVKADRHSWDLLYSLSSSLYKLTEDDVLYPLATTSMEQLWLAFVMKELHGKVWDGKEWVLPPLQ